MSLEKKNVSQPDETRKFENGQVDLVKVAGVTFGRAILEPGWKWSSSVKPIAKTETCQSAHLQFQVSGKLHVKMDDGSEMDFVAGDIVYIPPGHDAWVVGSEPVVIVDVTGMEQYAKQK